MARLDKPEDAGLVAAPAAAHSADWIRHADDASLPLERIEAFFAGRGYAMHRHDTYAIGYTVAGVQSFSYRGAVRSSLPGGTIVLHPDEQHDGQAGREDGFRYRMAYVEPSQIQAVLGGRALPFVEGALSSDARLAGAVRRLLQRPGEALAPLEYDDMLFELAHALDAASGGGARMRGPVDYAAAERARAFLHERVPEGASLAELERVAGRSRWALSRDFRRLFGTSPWRYLVMRRLDRAKAALAAGLPAAEAALDAGFADQSHMTRQFVRAFGVTPARWQRSLRR